jgi:hypothetical protein
MRTLATTFLIASLASVLLNPQDATASGQAVRLGIKAVGYFWAGAAGAVGYGVAESAGSDIYQSGKKALLGEQKKQLNPPQRAVYELSNGYWRTVTSARHCIELQKGSCTPCDLSNKVCNLRAEKPIIFSQHQVK